MSTESIPRFGLGLGVSHKKMVESGFANPATTVAQVAARLGARRVLEIHGASAEELQVVYKAEAGMTPRTIADLASGVIGKAVVKKWLPGVGINEEETGMDEGQKGAGKVDFDPLDGTSSYALGQRYSTVGLSIKNGSGEYMSAAIVQPFDKELVVAEKGKGAWLFPLNDKLAITAAARKLEVDQSPSFAGAVVYVDGLFNTQTTDPKLGFMKDLVGLGISGFRMTGSNIDQQEKVLTGRGRFGIIDAVGGVYDWTSGYAAITEAHGVMVDVLTGEPPTDKTQVAIYGNKALVDMALPLAQERYQGYEGFTKNAKKK